MQTADGIVLCGGRGTRMDGADKGLLEINGKAAARIAADLLRPLCGRIMINANRNLARYEALQIGPVIKDLRENFAGPLAGLEAARTQLQGNTLLVLPCDMPALPSQAPAMLLDTLSSRPELDVIYARLGADNHYLVAALRARALDSLTGYLDRGHRAVRHWYAELNSDALLFPPDLAAGFRNHNSVDDWECDG